MIRMGDDLYHSAMLSDRVQDRALRSFEQVRDYCQHMRVDKIFAFATSALRSAKNAKDFLAKLYRRTRIEVKVISGTEEAEWIARAILEREALPAPKNLLVDIGGGSTEISYVKQRSLRWSYSAPLGALRIQQMFFRDYFKLSTKEREQVIVTAKAYCRSVLNEFRPHPDEKRIPYLVGSSGTIKAIRRLIRKQQKVEPPLGDKELQLLLRDLRDRSWSELAAVKGLEERRRDLILPGLVLLMSVVDIYAVDAIYTSRFALRDGLLIAVMEKMLV